MADYDPTIDFAASPSQSGGSDAAVGWKKSMARARGETRNTLVSCGIVLGMFVIGAIVLTVVIWTE